MKRTKAKGQDEGANKMDEVRAKQALQNQILEVARMTREARVKYYEAMKKGPTKVEFQENVESVIHQIDLGEIPEQKPVFVTADEMLAAEYDEHGAGDDPNRRNAGLPCFQASMMYACYCCCLQMYGMKELYQHWPYRAAFYIFVSLFMFMYKTTVVCGVMILIVATVLLFAKWRGENEPILDDPWAKMSDLEQENDVSGSEEEEDDEEELQKQKKQKKKGRRMK